MNTALLILALVASHVAIALTLAGALRRRPAAGRLVGETLVVHTTDDQSIRGVVVAQHADRYELRDAVLLVSSDARHEIPGLTAVPVNSVSWWQHTDPQAPRPGRSGAKGGI